METFLNRAMNRTPKSVLASSVYNRAARKLQGGRLVSETSRSDGRDILQAIALSVHPFKWS